MITGLNAEEVISTRKDYWRLIRADELAILYDQNKNHLMSSLKLYKRLRHEHIDEDDVVWELKHWRELPLLHDKFIRRRARLRKLNRVILRTRKKLRILSGRRRELEDVVEDLR